MIEQCFLTVRNIRLKGDNRRKAAIFVQQKVKLEIWNLKIWEGVVFCLTPNVAFNGLSQCNSKTGKAYESSCYPST